MAELKITIPDDKVDRVKSAFVGIYPIPQKPDPENEGQQIPTHTEVQWSKECVRQFIIQTTQRWEQKVAMDAAKDTVERDAEIAV